MKKHISSSIFNAVIGYILLSLFLLSLASLFAYDVVPVIKGIKDGSVLVPFLFLTALYFLVLWTWNRMNCWVWIEDGYIKRKGLWFGYKKEVKISDIKAVQYLWIPRNGDYLFLIDGNKGNFIRLSKKCYISFSKSEKNLEFLSTFWNGRIEEYKKQKLGFNLTLEDYPYAIPQ